MAQILTATIHVRVTPEEKEKFQDAANDAAQSLGEWVRKALINSLQTTKPSAPGEGVLRMENGKHLAVIPSLPAVPASLPEIIDAIVPKPLPVTAPPTPGAQPTGAQSIPVEVVTAAPAKVSMVDRMYAIIEARDGKEKADFWLATSTGRQIRK